MILEFAEGGAKSRDFKLGDIYIHIGVVIEIRRARSDRNAAKFFQFLFIFCAHLLKYNCIINIDFMDPCVWKETLCFKLWQSVQDNIIKEIYGHMILYLCACNYILYMLKISTYICSSKDKKYIWAKFNIYNNSYYSNCGKIST